ncbi:MAG: transketolase [Bacteroidetes bacterium]|nr:MAG: transketolase [Bacteroidota bacterium]
MTQGKESIAEEIYQDYKKDVLDDFKLVCESREASLLGRREVLMGKAKFGIFGDGKEMIQVAMAKQFKNGDFRSGYYRDQTLMMAIDKLTIKEYFASLYADPNLEREPQTGGRQMNGHFATRSLNPDGSWKNLMEQKNSSADLSPTAGQMARMLGLAQASKVYRNNKDLHSFTNFTNKGNEVVFGTIGDASTSEGIFWETINAAGVLQVPMVLTVYDDGYGISVPKKYQTTKESISELLKGFQRTETQKGFEIFNTKGWDYPDLVKTYEEAVKISREEHVPVLIHVEEVTQPQGHSTSGSHERYKSKERLEWMKEYECVNQFRKWILERGDIATEEEVDAIQKAAKKEVRTQQKEAWSDFSGEIKSEMIQAVKLMEKLAAESKKGAEIKTISDRLKKTADPLRKDVLSATKMVLRLAKGEQSQSRSALIELLNLWKAINADRYNSHLYSQSEWAASKVKEVEPAYAEDAKMVDGRIIIRDNNKAILNKYPETMYFGEDVGKIGGVNQTLEGVQDEFGEHRVFDTGIREATIVGQGIGMAMRGLRPIGEIQYLDYVLYAIQIMSDDLATVQYRTRGGQKAPFLIITRGHRLEGIWHAGSELGGLVNLIRGMVVCVPRNMTQAAGFYNTMLASDDPGIIIEPLNGYRIKEKLPQNLGEYRIPVGVPEVVKKGEDLTLVSYGSTFNICKAVVEQLAEANIDVELIDVRTLLPFDKEGMITESIKKTNRLLIVDEDVKYGATAYMLDRILNEQGAYFYLDSEPKTLSAMEHRPAYGTDGDYFSKPTNEDVFDAVYEMMHEVNPVKFPEIYG